MGGAWHGAGRELFLGLGPNNRNNGNNGVWLAVVVLVVSNRLLFKPGSLIDSDPARRANGSGELACFSAGAAAHPARAAAVAAWFYG